MKPTYKLIFLNIHIIVFIKVRPYASWTICL